MCGGNRWWAPQKMPTGASSIPRSMRSPSVRAIWNANGNRMPHCRIASKPSQTDHEPPRNRQRPSRPIRHRCIAHSSGGSAADRQSGRLGSGFASGLSGGHARGVGIGDVVSDARCALAPRVFSDAILAGWSVGVLAVAGRVWGRGGATGLPDAPVGQVSAGRVAFGIELGPIQRLWIVAGSVLSRLFGSVLSEPRQNPIGC